MGGAGYPILINHQLFLVPFTGFVLLLLGLIIKFGNKEGGIIHIRLRE